MTKLHYSIIINAPREKVWKTMLDDATYRDWTSFFNPGGSYYEGNWEKGSKIHFIGPDPKTGKLGGMASRIADNRLYEYISIEHLGILKEDGTEDLTSDAAKKWAPAFENYTFKDKDGGTELSVDLDRLEEFAEMFRDVWPKALARLKELSEK
jgi:uncharacterized protein YndB with AHSA1/START domain